MRTTKELIDWLGRQVKMAEKEECPNAAASLEAVAQHLKELSAQLEAAKKDAERYQWLCEKGYNYHGAMAGTGSMSICRVPYILLEPPSHNKFSNLVLGKLAAGIVIDAAIAEVKA